MVGKQTGNERVNVCVLYARVRSRKSRLAMTRIADHKRSMSMCAYLKTLRRDPAHVRMGSRFIMSYNKIQVESSRSKLHKIFQKMLSNQDIFTGPVQENSRNRTHYPE